MEGNDRSGGHGVGFNYLKFILFLFILLNFSNLNATAKQNDEIYEGKPIRKLDIVFPAGFKDSDHWQKIVRNLLQINQNDLYSSKAFIQTINILSDTDLFASINVPDPKIFKDGLSIVFKLTPFDRIKKINIKGAFPFFKKEIQNIMTLFVGDGYIKENIKDQKLRIISFLKKEGYTDPSVDITAEKDNSDGHYILNITINKGSYLKIANVLIIGNKYVPSHTFRLKTKAWNFAGFFGGHVRFVQKDAESDVTYIVQKYRELGFADAEVAFEAKQHTQPDFVELMFSISEGSEYAFKFSGNSTFSRRQLKKEIAVFKEGNKHNFGIKKVFGISKKYVDLGFQDVKITTKTTEKKTDRNPVQQVTFNINEGHQYIVSDLFINGASKIDKGIVKQQILTGTQKLLGNAGYIKKQLDNDLNAIKILYLNQGYTQCKVDKKIKLLRAEGKQGETKNQVEIEIKISEGPQTQVGHVQFNGLVHLTEKKALEIISLKQGSPFREFMVESDENLIKATISEKGYPHIEIETQITFSKDGTVADLNFICHPGPLVRMGDVIYTGNFRTSPSILNNAMVVTPDSPLSLTRLLESRRNIRNINAVDSVRFRTPGLREKARRIDLVAEIQEKIPYYLEMGAGYDTRRKAYVETAAGDLNFFGRDLNLETNLEISQIGYGSSLSLHDPRFLGSKMSSSTRLFTGKEEELNKDFGTRTYGLSQEFSRSFFDKKLTVNLGTTYRFHEQFAIETTIWDIPENDIYEQKNIFTLNPSFVYRTTDSYVRPKKGVLISGNIDISNGIDSDLDNFVKYELESRLYYSPLNFLTLAMRGKYGIIQPYGTSHDVSEDQLFFLGGTSTIRGFEENLLRVDSQKKAAGGKQMFLGSLEARIDIQANIELAAFFDIGSVSSTTGASGSDALRSSIGGGIRYLTPIGPISLIYGHKLDALPEENSGSFHFSLGYTF